MTLPAQDRLGLDIKRTEQALMSAKAAALKDVSLTVAQYAALLALADNPGISSAALARACLVSPQAMTAVLRNLDERGLIERTPHPWHQNALEVRVTDTGAELLRRADERAGRIEQRILAELAPEEQETLRGLLARCVTAIQAEPGSETG
ncbi:DNA-binding MarR family transcriptional regulator [Lipingzhangella halophila]|uniref:DNA-binding MarR family transcriptional regulator n=1 Tax=Lipingzhangella halophila TaxID=1783352 RepID=A0A7W7RD75_9ACTN|nr:MarR family transcriptional regulator [Lipingzhangella halophila]MBB4929823.1 DNA-binding MarR family transcriptional regulator [Lipingzhangella halophila]